MLNLTINKLFLQNAPVSNQITVDLYIKNYYSGTYSLIEAGVLIDVDGTVISSPPPVVSIDPSQKYVIKAVNDACGFIYEQPVSLNPYCPIGFSIAEDGSYCFYELTTDATPPTSSENTVAAPYSTYSEWGTLIYDPGYNQNGTGTFTQIAFANTFWVNGIGYPNQPGTTVDGPMNRGALWATTTEDNQFIGFATCINIPEDDVYYVGIGGDNIPTISLDGQIVVQMDPVAMANYLAANGYPQILIFPNAASESTFNWWHIYPVTIPAGQHVLEMTCLNTALQAAMACEIYHSTPTELELATSYGDLGANLIFSTKDQIGLPVQIGSGGIGYSCAPGYSLRLCDSPPSCIRIVTTPILY